MKKWLKYSLLGILFWFIVDLTTTQAIKNPAHYYSTYMPALLIFYLGYPLLFSPLIYKFKLTDKKIFLINIFAALLVEIVFFQNALLFTFPIMLIMIPIAISIYTLLTFVPKWIVEGKLKENKWKLITLIAVYVLVSLATAFGSG
jgi:hypothetical protein